MANKPIFFDETGKRAARLSILGWAGAIISTLLGIAFLGSILVSQEVSGPDLKIKLSPYNDKLERRAVDPLQLKSAVRLAAEARHRDALVKSWKERLAHQKPSSRELSAALRPRPDRPLAMGFYDSSDNNDTSYPALKRALYKLDWFMPAWLTISGPNMALKNSVDHEALKLVRTERPALPILPLIMNVEDGDFDGVGLQRLLADHDRRIALEKSLVDYVKTNKYQGLVIDFEMVPKGAFDNLEAFLKDLQETFAANGWVLAQCVQFDDDAWPYARFAKTVDYTILMAYDEHDDAAGAGPIASEPWFEATLDQRMKDLPPNRTIIAVGSYAYDWYGNHPADTLTFQGAMVMAKDSSARVVFDPDTNNPHYSYIEDDHVRHDVWFLDGATVFNQVHSADVFQPMGYALWKIGSEDPTIWSVLGRPYGAPAPAALKQIPTSEDVDFEGEGEILRVIASPTPGMRSFETDPQSGDIADETYTKLPTTYVIRRVGAVPKTLALTFDDGPDPAYTPAILDILKAKNVKATFFIIGANAEAHPALLQRIIAEGHEVGNHTFTHPNLAETAPEADKLEYNATQKLFEALTGRRMVLFRPPYLGDAEPVNKDELIPVQIAQDQGYLTIGVHVDPFDWQQPSLDEMMQRIMHSVDDPNSEMRGNIILLHDSGGDRSKTVELLPGLIDQLRAKGYKFVPVSELAGLTRDQAMPLTKPSLALYANRVVFLTLSWMGTIFYYCFLAAIFLGLARLVTLCGLAVWNRRRAHAVDDPPAPEMHIPVSVIIPAYNEEKVIAATVARILASDYRDLEVIVIDDGSHDRTSEVVKEHFGAVKNVTLITIPNGGKARALNLGLERATGEVVVALDADTQFDGDTISRLVRWFVDPKVGAVAGNAKVGNRFNMITRWQALEYIVAQNLERRALAALGILTVVPGAVGAWRRQVLLDLGGYPTDTLAEDQDLTIHLQRAGYKVHFDSSAIAWTEAPSTFGTLAKQRFRWAYGTLQCLWKYRDMTFQKRYGMLGLVALPQVWMFQIILTALAPVADFLLIWQLLSQWVAYVQHGSEYSNNNLVTVGIYYVVFTLVDLAAAMVGFIMEKKENWSLLWWLMLQRFGYRQLMYYVVMRSIWTALRGAVVGWGKLERTGTVKDMTTRKAPEKI
jgi:cellulose synthase/poly-beta-1,6-N-acetylglucosamine synthase-like glycosyltransferase/peptidoglycan/xylan/chitin deacetylase (PgdA/CDA1 family)/spore germination protein YaaH